MIAHQPWYCRTIRPPSSTPRSSSSRTVEPGRRGGPPAPSAVSGWPQAISACPPPLSVTGKSRFDDPNRQFRVLYVAERRLGCFVEALAPLRPSLNDIAA